MNRASAKAPTSRGVRPPWLLIQMIVAFLFHPQGWVHSSLPCLGIAHQWHANSTKLRPVHIHLEPSACAFIQWLILAFAELGAGHHAMGE